MARVARPSSACTSSESIGQLATPRGRPWSSRRVGAQGLEARLRGVETVRIVDIETPRRAFRIELDDPEERALEGDPVARTDPHDLADEPALGGAKRQSWRSHSPPLARERPSWV